DKECISSLIPIVNKDPSRICRAWISNTVVNQKQSRGIWRVQKTHFQVQRFPQKHSQGLVVLRELFPAVMRVAGVRGGSMEDERTENTKCRSMVHSDVETMINNLLLTFYSHFQTDALSSQKDWTCLQTNALSSQTDGPGLQTDPAGLWLQMCAQHCQPDALCPQTDHWFQEDAPHPQTSGPGPQADAQQLQRDSHGCQPNGLCFQIDDYDSQANNPGLQTDDHGPQVPGKHENDGPLKAYSLHCDLDSLNAVSTPLRDLSQYPTNLYLLTDYQHFHTDWTCLQTNALSFQIDHPGLQTDPAGLWLQTHTLHCQTDHSCQTNAHPQTSGPGPQTDVLHFQTDNHCCQPNGPGFQTDDYGSQANMLGLQKEWILPQVDPFHTVDHGHRENAACLPAEGPCPRLQIMGHDSLESPLLQTDAYGSQSSIPNSRWITAQKDTISDSRQRITARNASSPDSRWITAQKDTISDSRWRIAAQKDTISDSRWRMVAPKETIPYAKWKIMAHKVSISDSKRRVTAHKETIPDSRLTIMAPR
ncbi:hypothetical protein DNTS_020819, partial [Danionella cerebrum]